MPEFLQSRRLCVISIQNGSNFNDPYDSQPIIVPNLSSAQIREYIEDMLQNPTNPLRDAAHIAKIYELKRSGKTRVGKQQIENIKNTMLQHCSEFLDKGGLLSFSLVADNPLLWGHYAAAFAGVCVVFKRGQSNQSAFSICAKVNYVQERPRAFSKSLS